MKDKETKKARRIQAIAICSCLCLLAIGAGVVYRAYDGGMETAQQPMQQMQEKPVTAVQSPTLDTAILERNQRSNDDGQAPDDAPKEQDKPPVQQTEKPAEPVFAYPLTGEIVLPYSIDHAIYDPTLEQYRTNAGVSLSAEQGAKVKAAADGRVKQIGEDAQTGNTVVLEHANGWLTTYGQLEDTVSVKEGEAVKQGQVIGAVDAPTKYGTALGTHLDFAMQKDGEPVNPQEKLQAE